MRSSTLARQSWSGRILKVTARDPGKNSGRMHDAIARRAYRIFEKSGSTPGHETENWKRAESEAVSPLVCGYLTLDDKISLNTDASVFAEGVIEVCVEPRRLTICGNARQVEENPTVGGNGSGSRGDIFRVLDLPVSIDPSQAKARFKGRILEVDLPKVQATQKCNCERREAA